MNVSRLSGIAIAALMAGSVGFTQAATLTGNVEARGTNDAVSASVVATKPDVAALQAAAAAGMRERVTLINRITDQFQGEAAGQYVSGFDATDWRYAFGARLMHQPASVLAAALAAGNLSSAQAVLASKTRGTLKHGDEGDLTLNFLATPCRIVDTRFGGGGLLGPSVRFWYATNIPAVIAAQGGAAAGCPQNPNAVAWIMNVTVVPTGAVGSGGANFLTVQHDSTVPTVASMTYYPGTILSNFATTLCLGCGGGIGGFYAYASLNTHVVIDLIGYAGVDTAPSGRAAAYVTTAAAFDAARTRNFTAVTRPSTGVYCLTPSPLSLIDPITSVLMVSIDWSNSVGSTLAAYHRTAATGGGCAVSDFSVLTYDFAGNPSNSVAFEVFVP